MLHVDRCVVNMLHVYVEADVSKVAEEMIFFLFTEKLGILKVLEASALIHNFTKTLLES